jgi:hypothetical protein
LEKSSLNGGIFFPRQREVDGSHRAVDENRAIPNQIAIQSFPFVIIPPFAGEDSSF